ncbi:MAG: VanZ family protein [Cetobacterium sp.]|uniref:VanZ family protein n=1 Tax=Cetobacterium sp. TaxID=2071632 RepID=UPI003F3B9D2A
MIKRESIFKISSVLVMLTIFWFSHQNGEESLKQSNFMLQYLKDLLDIFNLDVRKLAHFTIYFILGANYFLAFKELTFESAVKSIGLTMLYAISDEFHQSFIPNRGPAVKDVLIDTSGGALAILVIVMYLDFKNRKYALEK